MNRKNIIIAIIALAIVLVGVSVLMLSNRSRSSIEKGTSTIPSLDIVSGEVTKQDIDDTLIYISNLSGSNITPKDIVLRKDSYKKTYAEGYKGYTVNFIADIQKVKSSYDVSIQNLYGSSMGTVVTCSNEQLQDYNCLDRSRIEESQ